MRWSRFVALMLSFALASTTAVFARQKSCVTTDDAAKMLKKDVCISAHVYDVVQVNDGTRFLDVCSRETPDDQCRFTIVSLSEDRETVGELTKYRDADVQIRGIVQPMNGRSGMFLSHARQFAGGPPKFTPNPLLSRGFSAEQSRPPISDPNLRSQGSHRAFMDKHDTEPLPQK